MSVSSSASSSQGVRIGEINLIPAYVPEISRETEYDKAFGGYEQFVKEVEAHIHLDALLIDRIKKHKKAEPHTAVEKQIHRQQTYVYAKACANACQTALVEIRPRENSNWTERVQFLIAWHKQLQNPWGLSQWLPSIAELPELNQYAAGFEIAIQFARLVHAKKLHEQKSFADSLEKLAGCLLGFINKMPFLPSIELDFAQMNEMLFTIPNTEVYVHQATELFQGTIAEKCAKLLQDAANQKGNANLSIGNCRIGCSMLLALGLMFNHQELCLQAQFGLSGLKIIEGISGVIQKKPLFMLMQDVADLGNGATQVAAKLEQMQGNFAIKPYLNSLKALGREFGSKPHGLEAHFAKLLPPILNGLQLLEAENCLFKKPIIADINAFQKELLNEEFEKATTDNEVLRAAWGVLFQSIRKALEVDAKQVTEWSEREVTFQAKQLEEWMLSRHGEFNKLRADRIHSIASLVKGRLNHHLCVLYAYGEQTANYSLPTIKVEEFPNIEIIQMVLQRYIILMKHAQSPYDKTFTVFGKFSAQIDALVDLFKLYQSDPKIFDVLIKDYQGKLKLMQANFKDAASQLSKRNHEWVRKENASSLDRLRQIALQKSPLRKGLPEDLQKNLQPYYNRIRDSQLPKTPVIDILQEAEGLVKSLDSCGLLNVLHLVSPTQKHSNDYWEFEPCYLNFNEVKPDTQIKPFLLAQFLGLGSINTSIVAKKMSSRLVDEEHGIKEVTLEFTVTLTFGAGGNKISLTQVIFQGIGEFSQDIYERKDKGILVVYRAWEKRKQQKEVQLYSGADREKIMKAIADKAFELRKMAAEELLGNTPIGTDFTASLTNYEHSLAWLTAFAKISGVTPYLQLPQKEEIRRVISSYSKTQILGTNTPDVEFTLLSQKADKNLQAIIGKIQQFKGMPRHSIPNGLQWQMMQLSSTLASAMTIELANDGESEVPEYVVQADPDQEGMAKTEDNRFQKSVIDEQQAILRRQAMCTAFRDEIEKVHKEKEQFEEELAAYQKEQSAAKNQDDMKRKILTCKAKIKQLAEILKGVETESQKAKAVKK